MWVHSLGTAAAALIRTMQSSTALSWTVYRAASRSSYTRKQKFKSAATKRPTCRTASLIWLSAMCRLGSIRSRTANTTSCTFKFTITFYLLDLAIASSRLLSFSVICGNSSASISPFCALTLAYFISTSRHASAGSLVRYFFTSG